MGFAAGVSARTNRDKFREQKRQADIELQKAGYSIDGAGKLSGSQLDVDNQARELMMQELGAQADVIKSLRGREAARLTEEVLVDFAKNGDANIIQKGLNSNTFLKEALKKTGIEAVTNIDTSNDKELLQSAGVTPDMLSNPEFQEQMKKSMWKYYDGKDWNIGFANQFIAEAGILNKSTSTENRNILVEGLGRLKSALKGNNVALDEQDSGTRRMNAQANVKRLDNQSNQLNDKMDLEREILEYKKSKLDMDAELGKGLGNKARNQRLADGYTENLVAAFGGEEAYFSADLSDKDNYLKAFKYVNSIEQVGGHKLSGADKKELNNMRQLLALGNPAGSLSNEDTGLLDNFLSNTNKYLTDNIGGIEAKSAYAAFRNTVRHALFGSALTDGEIKSFREAFGTLGQRLGPVLQQFKTNLVQVKAKLDSIRRNSNPYTMKFRLGVDEKRIDSIISSIDQRINTLNEEFSTNYSGKELPDKSLPSSTNPVIKKSLSTFSEGSE